MEIRQLRSFVAVADTLNFSRAADSLYLSQPALTRQIQELERELGVPLIIRTTRRVELTTAGEELRHRAKDLISRMEKIPPEVKKLAGRDKSGKTLNVGMDESSMESLIRRKQLADAVYALRSAYPGLIRTAT